MSSERPPLTQINPTKLLHSKWTAVIPANRERHFMVVKLHRDELERIVEVDLEAVITGRTQRMDWQTLRDRTVWRTGWL
ncbi:TIGR02450 family Trp-rich protein [Halopseudomonas nanhaiensis]|uniref:TIGR02450 family Trp-rich protein n=1 Tax=Halopseudomonas nanhaiensis TaxID=2830842 RepID=UPI001CBCDD49|nr:TIGR02450 family Trp-rich protein [Halopseudomonas nanhaiensis]UAW97914.1 TIGR02450 family Trp-rich protein [Halopseudomonas nanhaiensis]